MIVMLQSKKVVYMGIGNQIVTVHVETGRILHYDLPPIKLPEHNTKVEGGISPKSTIISSLTISKSGSILAVSTENRQIVTYKLEDWKVLSNFVISRSASKICFDAKNNIIIADKTGDVYLYEDGSDPMLLLGHLSLILDICISECGKYIVTSDRDEKIRVSHYPNSYNILSYCLGHQEFVTNLSIVNNQLLSASGDGTLAVWDFKCGDAIALIDTNANMKDEHNFILFKAIMAKDGVEVNAVPVTDMQVYEYATVYALIAVTLFNQNSIITYEYNYLSKKIVYIQTIDVSEDATIITFSLDFQLCVLTNKDLTFYNFEEPEKRFVLQLLDADLFKSMDSVFNKITITTNVKLLYKRKFDNVQEYLSRKKTRLDRK